MFFSFPKDVFIIKRPLVNGGYSSNTKFSHSQIISFYFFYHFGKLGIFKNINQVSFRKYENKNFDLQTIFVELMLQNKEKKKEISYMSQMMKEHKFLNVYHSNSLTVNFNKVWHRKNINNNYREKSHLKKKYFPLL